MTTQHVTLIAKAQNGKVTVKAEIPVTDDAESYVVSIDIAPQPKTPAQTQTLDQFYGALADDPLPENIDDPKRVCSPHALFTR